MNKNGELLFDFKERIKSKYGYDEEFAETISMAAEDIAYHLGEEFASVVYRAFEECKFVIQKGMKTGDKKRETVLDVIKNEGMYEEIRKDTTTEENLQKATSAYVSVPQMSFDGSTYQIDSINRMIVLPSNFNNDSIGSYQTLIHEGLRLVNSYINEYQIEGDILTIKSGLATETQKLSKDGKNVNRTFVSRTGQGLESGINLYDEMSIVSEARDANHTPTGNDNLRLTAGQLMDGMGLKEIIRTARMTKDDTELRKIVDDYSLGGYEEFIQTLDEEKALEIERSKALLDDEQRQKVEQAIKEHFENKTAPQMQSIKHNIAKEVEYGYRKSS